VTAARSEPVIRWIDNHCHLPAGRAGDERVEAAVEAGVVRMIDVGTTLERSHQVIATAKRHPGVLFASAGVSPHDADEGLDGIAELLDVDEVVAVGECGLDYYYEHSSREVQRDVFAAQVALANSHDLALIIHSRDAWDDTFEVLDSEGVPERAVFHCFTGGPDEADAALERGAVLSFSGIVTFKNADDLRAAVERTPVDRLMVETDSPYLAPEPRRGKQNEPANLPLVGEKVAQVLGLDTLTVAEAAWTTAHRIYGLPTLD
jgi:TatD DNase family protein